MAEKTKRFCRSEIIPAIVQDKLLYLNDENEIGLLR